MSKDLDISVLIPTYNRAEILRETLEAMCQVKRDGQELEFLMIEAQVTEGFLSLDITGAWILGEQPACVLTLRR